MSDWADKKARELCYRGWHEAAAQELDVAAALREAYERGRQEERWACHMIASDFADRFGGTAGAVDIRISARGPMRKPEEEE